MTHAKFETCQLASRAKVLLENTKKLRFFRGQAYDGGADEYLRQLHEFLVDVIAAEQSPQREEKND